MSDRITRPTVRLAGGAPDGNLSNLEAQSGRQLATDPPPLYAIVRLTRTKLIEDDDQEGAETAVLKVRAMEVLDVLPDLAHPGMPLAELLSSVRAERTGDNPIPFDDDGSAARADRAMQELRDWQAAADLDDAGLTTAWGTYFQGHQLGEVPTWRDADPALIREFVLAMEDAEKDGPDESHLAADPEYVRREDALLTASTKPAFEAPTLTAVQDQP